MALTPNRAVNLLTEALVKYKRKLKSQYQDHLNDIEKEVRDWLCSGASELTVENLDLVFTRFMVARQFDAALPDIDIDAVRAALPEDEGALELQNRIASLEERNKVLAFALAFVLPGIIESNKQRQVAVTKITVLLNQQINPKRDAVPQSVWHKLVSAIAIARKGLKGADLEIFEVTITGRRVSIIQTQDAVMVPQPVWNRLASAIANARKELKGADLKTFEEIIAHCKVWTKERGGTTESTEIRTRTGGKDDRFRANFRQTVAEMDHEMTELGKLGDTASERNRDEDHIGDTAISVISLSSGDEDEDHWQVKAEESAEEIGSKNLPDDNHTPIDRLVEVYKLAAKEIPPIEHRPDPSRRLQGKTITEFLRDNRGGEASRAATTEMQYIADNNSLTAIANTRQTNESQKDRGDSKGNHYDLSAAETSGTCQHSGILKKHTILAKPIGVNQQDGPPKDNMMEQLNLELESFKQKGSEGVSTRTRLDLAVNDGLITIDFAVDERLGNSKSVVKKCDYCNVVGHRSKNCPKRKADKRSLGAAVATGPSKDWKVKCYYCHASGRDFVGHIYSCISKCQKLWVAGQPAKKIVETQSSSALQAKGQQSQFVQRMREYCSGLGHLKKDCEQWKADVRAVKALNELYNKQTNTGAPETEAPAEGQISYIQQDEDLRQLPVASNAEQGVQQESIDNMKDDIKQDPSTYPQENLYDSETDIEDSLVSNARAAKKSREEAGTANTPEPPAKRARLTTSRDEKWANAQRRLEGSGRKLVGSVPSVLPQQDNFIDLTGDETMTHLMDRDPVVTRDGNIIVQNISMREKEPRFLPALEAIIGEAANKRKRIVSAQMMDTDPLVMKDGNVIVRDISMRKKGGPRYLPLHEEIRAEAAKEGKPTVSARPSNWENENIIPLHQEIISPKRDTDELAINQGEVRVRTEDSQKAREWFDPPSSSQAVIKVKEQQIYRSTAREQEVGGLRGETQALGMTQTCDYPNKRIKLEDSRSELQSSPPAGPAVGWEDLPFDGFYPNRDMRDKRAIAYTDHKSHNEARTGFNPLTAPRAYFTCSSNFTKQKETKAQRRARRSAGAESEFNPLTGPRSGITTRGQADGETATRALAQEAGKLPEQQTAGLIGHSCDGRERSSSENISSVVPAFNLPTGPRADDTAKVEPSSRRKTLEQEPEALQREQYAADLIVSSSDSRKRNKSKHRHCVVVAALNPKTGPKEGYKLPLAKVMAKEVADLRGDQLAAALIGSTGPSLLEGEDNKASGAGSAAISNTIFKLLDDSYWRQKTGELGGKHPTAFIGPSLPADRSSVVSGFNQPTDLSKRAQKPQEELASELEGLQREKQAAVLDSSSKPGGPNASLDTVCLVCQIYQKKCDRQKPKCSGCKGDGLLCTWPQNTHGSEFSPEDTNGESRNSCNSSEESTRGYLRYYDLPDREVEES